MSLVTIASTAGLSGLLVKGTILLTVGWLGTRALRRGAASARHVLWLGVIVAVLVLPALTRVASVRLPVLPASGTAPATGVTSISLTTDSSAIATSPPMLSSNPVTAERERETASGTRNYGSIAFAVWLGVMLFVVSWIGAGMLVIRRIIRGARVVDSPEWSNALADAAAQLTLSPRPRLLMSDQVETAFAWDVFSPAIVLPTNAAEWSDDRRRAVLLHELAHIGRRDLVGHLTASIACAVYWFHPLVWLAARRLRAESELACDDVVLRAGLRPSDYAQHLLDIVAGLGGRRTTPAFVVPMARSRDFEGRLQAILERANRRPVGRTQLAILIGALALLTTTMAAVVPVPRPAPARRMPVPPQSPPAILDTPAGAPVLPATMPAPKRSTATLQVVLPPVRDSVVTAGADTAIAPRINVVLGPCDRTFGTAQIPAIVDSAYARLFYEVTLSADRQSKMCELLASLHFQQAAMDSITEVTAAANRVQTQTLLLQQNTVLRALLSNDADRAVFDARVAQGMGAFGGGGGARGRGGAPSADFGAVTPVGGFRGAGGGGGGRGARGNITGGGDTTAVASGGRARGGGGGGVVTVRPQQPLIVVDGVVVGQAARDSMAAELQAAAAKASASATLRRLFDGLTLTPEQESTALDVILATQKEIRALAPPRRPARLRIPPVGGIVSMQATSAEELLSFVADDTDRAKVRARIVIIPQ